MLQFLIFKDLICDTNTNQKGTKEIRKQMKQMNKMFQLYKMRIGSEMNFQRGSSIQEQKNFRWIQRVYFRFLYLVSKLKTV